MNQTWKKGLVTGALTTALLLGGAVPTLAADGDIAVLYTNDVHCGIEDHIGYSGLALYQQQMESQYDYVTLVDAGDAIQGAPIGMLSDGGYLVDIMNYAGYDMAVPGNHEFDYGMERLLELSKQLDGGYYSCNLMDLRTGKTVFEPYKMMTYGDVQVAYIGVTTPESLTKSTPAYFQDEKGNYIYGFCEDESGKALYQAVQSAVDQARAEGADYVIGLFHLGANDVTERWSSAAVIGATTGIDAVIDGHSHEEIDSKMINNLAGESVLLTQTGTKLANIGKLVIEEDGDITAELIAAVDEETSVDAAAVYQVQKGDSLSKIAKQQLGAADLWDELYESNRDKIKNPNLIYPGMMLTMPTETNTGSQGTAMTAFIDEIQAQYEESLKDVLGHSDYELTTLDVQTGERAIRNAETNLGDLCADAYRLVLGTDIGVMNGGGIRADLASGNITYNDTLNVFPYGNMICAVAATGQQIMDALEMGAMYYPEESGGFLQVSGLTYSIDSSVPSSVVTDEKGNFVKVEGTYRVQDIMVGDQPLALDKIYTLASHNYMLKSGGDGMNMFADCDIVLDDVMTDVEVLSTYINETLGGSVGDAYADPTGQNRITIK